MEIYQTKGETNAESPPTTRRSYVRDEPRPGRGIQALSWPHMLVATSLDEASAVALRRGQALATILEAKLVVVHVVPPHSWVNMLFPQKFKMDAAAMTQLFVTALASAREWTLENLDATVAHPAIMLKRGRIAGTILEAAHDVHASLIVLGDSGGASARLFGGRAIAAAVVQRAGCPVLVARPERANSEIVAATNFADAAYPALCKAAQLGVRLGAHVTFVHNLHASDYVATASLLGLPVQAAVIPREPELEQRAHELADVARSIGTDIESVVVTRDRSSDAILDVARARDADMVVVGVRKRRGRITDRTNGTAVTVAREARRSVLTVPLGHRQVSGWA